MFVCSKFYNVVDKGMTSIFNRGRGEGDKEKIRFLYTCQWRMFLGVWVIPLSSHAWF